MGRKTIVTVFVILGVVVLCLVVWFFVFNNGVSTIYNGVQSVVNGAWHDVAGEAAEDIIPDDFGDEAGTLDGAKDKVGELE